MNKIIKDQLNKVSEVKLEFNNDTTKIIIPKTTEMKASSMQIGKVYEVLIDGIKYLVEVDNVSGNCLFLNGVEVNNPTKTFYKLVSKDDIKVIKKEG